MQIDYGEILAVHRFPGAIRFQLPVFHSMGGLRKGQNECHSRDLLVVESGGIASFTHLRRSYQRPGFYPRPIHRVLDLFEKSSSHWHWTASSSLEIEECC